MSHSSISATATMNFDLDLTLEGNDLNIDFSSSLAGMTRIYDRIMFVSEASFVELFVMKGTDAPDEDGNTLEDFDMLYIQNLDENNDCTICIGDRIAAEEGVKRAEIKIPPKRFFVLFSNQYNAVSSGIPDTASETIITIDARFDTHEGRLRILAFEN